MKGVDTFAVDDCARAGESLGKRAKTLVKWLKESQNRTGALERRAKAGIQVGIKGCQTGKSKLIWKRV